MSKNDVLYVVVDSGGFIIGLTEEKKIAKRFVKERSKARLEYVKINKKKDKNQLIIDNDDKFIIEEPLLGILITESESKDFVEEIYHEIYRIKSVVRDLEYMRGRYNIPDKIDNKIKKGIDGMNEITNPHILGEVFGLEILTKALTVNKNLLKGYGKRD